MTRTKAIAKKCLECAGDSPKEVTLCHSFECPLWEWRTGKSINSTAYKKRIQSALNKYREDVNALRDMGVDISFFIGKHRKIEYVAKN